MPSDTSPDSPAVSVDAPADSAPVPGDSGTGSDSPVVVHRFEFRGTTGEFFRIWIVNTLLTVVTLGLFSPWAKVRTRRYFHASAFLDGANFDYRANPWSILLARLLVVAVVVGGAYYVGEDLLQNAVHATLLALLLPWALVRGLAFNARYSTHRGARFAFKKETARAYLIFAPLTFAYILPGYLLYFTAAPDATMDTVKEPPVQFMIVLSIVAALCLFIIAPWLMRAWHRFKADNHSLGSARFQFEKPHIREYLAALWIIPILGLFLFVVAIFIAAGITRELTDESSAGSGQVALLFLVFAVIVYFPLVIMLTCAAAYLFRTFWTHIRFTVGGESGKFRVDFATGEFAVKILIVNYIAIFFSLGLLYPWAKIRRARFLAANIAVETTPAALEKIPPVRGESEGALGEELDAAEGFDFDVGLV